MADKWKLICLLGNSSLMSVLQCSYSQSIWIQTSEAAAKAIKYWRNAYNIPPLKKVVSESCLNINNWWILGPLILRWHKINFLLQLFHMLLNWEYLNKKIISYKSDPISGWICQYFWHIWSGRLSKFLVLSALLCKQNAKCKVTKLHPSSTC